MPLLALSAHRAWVALSDIPINGATALLVVLPLALRPLRWRLVLLAVAVGILIDVDHAVAARSIRLEAMLSLPVRPATHSLLFAALASLVGWAVSRRAVVAWIILAALVSHLLRDASGYGTPLLWPLEASTRIPAALYPAGVAALFGLSWLIRARGAAPRRLPDAEP
ncbi:MAG: metal-dependent hydrolase [Candidatus Krumholzibacteriota bacterium]|nr:metal-dependent hydrolase [Candidatus Krumholzibacteriota bacterium]